MLDRSLKGRALSPHTVQVERGRLRFFAQATGQRDPAYLDLSAAQAAGHPDLPVPPTFLFCLGMDSPHFLEFHTLLGMDLPRILHGEQAFAYHRMAYAGDVLTLQPTIEDVFDKRGGALEFAVRATKVTNDRGEHVADLREVLVQPGQARGAE